LELTTDTLTVPYVERPFAKAESEPGLHVTASDPSTASFAEAL